MNQLQIFENQEFGEIRTVTINNEIWFVAKDISEVLGYNQTSNMLKRIDIEDIKKIAPSILDDSISSMARTISTINESGLYSAILGSKLPDAKKFKHWVTSEVLPSIRKNGGYIANQENLSPEQIVANALLVAQNIIKQKDELIEKQKPKVLFADAVSASHTSILVGDLAKLIKQNGIDIGQKRLFAWLREKGYLIKRNGNDYNMPTQRSMEMELFEIKETSISHSDGHITVSKTPKVTGKGQMYFVNKFLTE